MKVGTKIRINRMEGEPQYDGKDGVVTHISKGNHSFGIPEQWHGTWGGCAVQPQRDEYTVLCEA